MNKLLTHHVTNSTSGEDMSRTGGFDEKSGIRSRDEKKKMEEPNKVPLQRQSK